MAETPLWGSHSFSVGEERCFTLGRLDIGIRRTVTTWQYAFRQLPVSSPETGEGVKSGACEDMTWSTFISDSRVDLVTLLPAAPDRPLVARTEQQIYVAPGASYTFFTAIPLWIQAWVGRPGTQLLFDVPTRRFSSTWFGGAMTGRLCYTSSEQVVRHAHSVHAADGAPSAYCPVSVRNNAHVPLSFNKLPIFADLMRIYETTDTTPANPSRRKRRGVRKGVHIPVALGDLWTNEAIAVYSTEEELNISVSDRSPEIPATLTLLNGPRNQDADNIIRRGLILLRRISNY
ncbi:MAG: hypothetical protein ACLFNQ_00630 [Spirochaetaceae bacterium]